MPPHETLFLESTHSVDIHSISHNEFLTFQTWDFGGDLSLQNDLIYSGRNIPIDVIFRNCSSLIYVIDAQEDDYEDALARLVETIGFAHNINKNIHFEVFLHKLDGYYMSEEKKSERQQGVQTFVSTELAENYGETSGDVLVSYYLTSIYDHSVSEAFSKVISTFLTWSL